MRRGHSVGSGKEGSKGALLYCFNCCFFHIGIKTTLTFTTTPTFQQLNSQFHVSKQLFSHLRNSHLGPVTSTGTQSVPDILREVTHDSKSKALPRE